MATKSEATVHANLSLAVAAAGDKESVFKVESSGKPTQYAVAGSSQAALAAIAKSQGYAASPVTMKQKLMAAVQALKPATK